MKEPMRECKYFISCSAPKCPLDPEMNIRTYIKGEPVCKLDKRSRKSLGKNLPNKGLFPKELGGLKAWKNTSLDKRLNVVKFGEKNLKTLHIEGVILES